MKILLTGKTGQVGGELNNLLKDIGELVSLGREHLDLSKITSIEPAILDIQPDIIINAAAHTAVDKAEEEESELAMTVNGIAPGVLAKAAKKIGASLIHYSTDYVFDGHSDTPYHEEDITCPLTIYGESKLAGEKSIAKAGIPYLILRTSWVYSLQGKSFLRTIKKLAEEKDTLRIVDDQIGAPTWARSIALATRKILEQYLRDGLDPSLSGIFHLTCQGKSSWYDFAKEILNISSATQNTQLLPIPSSDYPTPAIRPLYSLLSNDKLEKVFGFKMPHWHDSLKDCINSTSKI
jgi:dTDP-4-dehydrorhamnose reductase